MSNIVWKKPDGSVAITALALPLDPAGHAAELQARSDVPADWEAVGFGAAVPSDRSNRSGWRWADGKIMEAPGLADAEP